MVLSVEVPKVLWREEFETLPELGPERAVAKIEGWYRAGMAQHATIAIQEAAQRRETTSLSESLPNVTARELALRCWRAVL